MSWTAYQDIRSSGEPTGGDAPEAVGLTVEKEITRSYEEILAGGTFEWSADDQPELVQRQIGPYVLNITKKRSDGLIAPVIEVASHGQSLRIEGEATSSGYTHRVSAVQNMRGAPPIVMLESFTGGAHCCNVVTLAGFSGGKLKAVELGTWDGDRIEIPKDISGDGVADFVVRDDSFLYAFSSYASSYAPPKILNVVNGRVTDVSGRPAFTKIFANFASEAGQVCQLGQSGDQRNGACSAYVAAAARSGKLREAWAKMLVAYDARVDWDFPSGCRIQKSECPPGLEIKFKSYPESLLFFLRREGYISKSWLPPEAYPSEEPQERSDGNYTA